MISDAQKPSEIFCDILKTMRFASGLVGANVFDNFRFNWLTALVIGSIVSYFILTILTIVKLFAEDWKILLEATCMASSVIQGVAKLYCVITRGKTLENRRYFFESLYEEYERKGTGYHDVLLKSCLKLRRVVQLISVTYFGPAIIVLCMPFCFLLLNGQRYLIMQFHVPFLDVNTRNGHLSTLAIHTAFMFVGTVGLYAGDLIVVIFLWQCLVFTDVFKLKIDELNCVLNTKDGNVEQRNNVVVQQLIELVKWHQLYTNYTKICNETFFEIISIVVSTAGISILLALFILLYGTWPGAFPYLIVSFYNLYIYCILGTRIEISNDEFAFQIYNAKWYKMPPAFQKTVGLMLMQSQNPQTMEVAGIVPLSVSTALQITKTVYSVFAMMVQFMDETTA